MPGNRGGNYGFAVREPRGQVARFKSLHGLPDAVARLVWYRMTSFAGSWLPWSKRMQSSVMRNGIGEGRQRTYNWMVPHAE